MWDWHQHPLLVLCWAVSILWLLCELCWISQICSPDLPSTYRQLKRSLFSYLGAKHSCGNMKSLYGIIPVSIPHPEPPASGWCETGWDQQQQQQQQQSSSSRGVLIDFLILDCSLGVCPAVWRVSGGKCSSEGRGDISLDSSIAPGVPCGLSWGVTPGLPP